MSENEMTAYDIPSSEDLAAFQDYGYMGLYGGLRAQDIRTKKDLSENQLILNHMGFEELGANAFMDAQTDAKLRRENIQDKEEANQAHYEVGKKVRQTIEELGGTMPEELSTPEMLSM